MIIKSPQNKETIEIIETHIKCKLYFT